jgi:predicted N-acetyltransferase YhbS
MKNKEKSDKEFFNNVFIMGDWLYHKRTGFQQLRNPVLLYMYYTKY